MAPPVGSLWYCATHCPTPRTPPPHHWCPSDRPSFSMGTPTPQTQVGGARPPPLHFGSAPFSQSHFSLLLLFFPEPPLPPPPPQDRAHRPPPEAPPTAPPPPGSWNQELVVCIQPARSASPPEGTDETHKVRNRETNQEAEGAVVARCNAPDASGRISQSQAAGNNIIPGLLICVQGQRSSYQLF